MLSSPVVMSARWKVVPAQTSALTMALQAVMLATRGERGCLSCRLSTEVGNQVTFSYEEAWATEGDLRRHIRSGRFARVAGLVECATEPPQFTFTVETGVRGLDYAEEVRCDQGPLV